MDRDRLKQVHQTDLTESRINEDFVEWLKTKGPSWLLLILVVLCGYLGIHRWNQYKAEHFAEAWTALAEARLPGSFEDVAARYAEIPGLQQQAKMMAADTLIESIQLGQPVGTDPFSTEPTQLTADERVVYLQRAERLYSEMIAADDGSLAMTLHVVSALQGLAVVAESRGDAAVSREKYEASAKRAEEFYPSLAARLRLRGATTDMYASDIVLPDRASLPTPPPSERQPVIIDDALRGLLLPDESNAG